MSWTDPNAWLQVIACRGLNVPVITDPVRSRAISILWNRLESKILGLLLWLQEGHHFMSKVLISGAQHRSPRPFFPFCNISVSKKRMCVPHLSWSQELGIGSRRPDLQPCFRRLSALCPGVPDMASQLCVLDSNVPLHKRPSFSHYSFKPLFWSWKDFPCTTAQLDHNCILKRRKKSTFQSPTMASIQLPTAAAPFPRKDICAGCSVDDKKVSRLYASWQWLSSTQKWCIGVHSTPYDVLYFHAFEFTFESHMLQRGRKEPGQAINNEAQKVT